MESGRPCCDLQWQVAFPHEAVLPPKPGLPAENDTERMRTCPSLCALWTETHRMSSHPRDYKLGLQGEKNCLGFESTGQVQPMDTTTASGCRFVLVHIAKIVSYK